MNELLCKYCQKGKDEAYARGEGIQWVPNCDGRCKTVASILEEHVYEDYFYFTGHIDKYGMKSCQNCGFFLMKTDLMPFTIFPVGPKVLTLWWNITVRKTDTSALSTFRPVMFALRASRSFPVKI